MAIQRVGRGADALEGEGNAFLQAGGGDLLVQRVDARLAAEFLHQILLAVLALRRDRRVELIGLPAQGNGNVRQARQRLFQPPLADIAPGADHVGNDVDGHRGLIGGGPGGCLLPARGVGLRLGVHGQSFRRLRQEREGSAP